MKNSTFLLPSIVVAVLTACSPADQKHERLVASIDSVVQAAVDTARFNGNVLFARNGKVVFQKSFGWSNFDTKEVLNDSSLFELASVSKQFTAMGIMMLNERGKLNYDDDVRKYIPELSYDGMTIRHFLTHTSGIPGYDPLFEGSKWNKDSIAYNEDLVTMFTNVRPLALFKPGEQFKYSNTGYALLAIVIARVSGQSYGEFLKENIFLPVGMLRSRTYNTRRSGEMIPNYAYGFEYSDSLRRFMLPDSIEKFYFVYTMDGIEGDGAVNSTTGDLFRWSQALYGEGLVKSPTLEEAFKPVALNDGSTYPYGFGWRIGSDSTLGKFVLHSGGWPGYYSHIRRYLDNGDLLVLLSNNAGLGKDAVIKEIEKRLRREKAAVAR